MELKYEIYIDGQPEQIWGALVSPEGTRQVFYGCVIQSSFVPGEAFAYVGPGNDGDETVHLYGTVLAYEPNHKFSYLEHPGMSYHANHAELQSRVTFLLEKVGGCTKLTLVNDEWTENHPSFSNTEQSWWMILSNIKTYVETGKTLDFGW